MLGLALVLATGSLCTCTFADRPDALDVEIAPAAIGVEQTDTPLVGTG